MLQTFSRSGVSFRFPANWTLDLDETDDGGWVATAQSTETAFLLVSLRPDAADPMQLADETLEAVRAEYKELDAVPFVGPFAGQPAVGHDIDFLTLDTAAACRTRCLDTPAGPLLVMSQASEYDREQHEPVLRAIAESFAIDPD